MSNKHWNAKQIIADWKFGPRFTEGSIADGSLVIKDQSGNGNDLQMQLYANGQLTKNVQQANWEDYVSFAEDCMTGDGGSMSFHGDRGITPKAQKAGVDFITAAQAAINKNQLLDGYTIEILYYLPEHWTAAEEWMSIMTRQGKHGGNPEDEQGSMYISVSNCKEIQFVTANARGNHAMASAAWSVSMDEGGVWYHIAIISDGHKISTFVNGCEAFRNYVSDDMVGMYADPDDGRFRIGSCWWESGNETLDKFLQGKIQQIRIIGAPIGREDWLISNPESYVGTFGSNRAYRRKNEDTYCFALIPDSQNTVKFCPSVMEKTIDQLIAKADEFNLKAVIHLGDVVDDFDSAVQYQRAKNIFYRLPQSGIKFLIQPGNHDNCSDGNSSYGGLFGADSAEYHALTQSYLYAKAWSGAMFVRAGSYTYMIISLSCVDNETNWSKQSGELEWFEQMLQEHPDCPTIVTRHDVQNCSDTAPSSVKLSGEGKKLWEIVKKYPQVFMMVGGHSHGSGVEMLKNDMGQDVISILTDLQFSHNGGNGWFRYLEFDEASNKIYYSIYSPYAASLQDSEKTFFDVNFLTGDGHEGEIDIPFHVRFHFSNCNRS